MNTLLDDIEENVEFQLPKWVPDNLIECYIAEFEPYFNAWVKEKEREVNEIAFR